jgi:hypothetical protein
MNNINYNKNNGNIYINYNKNYNKNNGNFYINYNKKIKIMVIY